MSGDPTGRISHLPDMHRGVAWKEPCRLASTGNLTLSGLQTIDGVAGAAGDRVLVKDQTTGSQNGLYTMASGAWTRTFDMDQDATTSVPASEVLGAVIEVIAGTVNGGTFWRCSNTALPVLGTTALTFAAFGGSVSYATPAIVLGTAATAGAATTAIRSDSTIVAFDATLPAAVTPGAGRAGSAAVAARRDHSHPFTPPQPLVEDDGAGSFALVFEANGEVIWE